MCTCVCAVCPVAHSCLTLWSHELQAPGFSVHEISLTRRVEWVAMPSSRGSSQPRDQTRVSCTSSIGKQVLYHRTTWEAPTYTYTHSCCIVPSRVWLLCNPLNCSPPGSSVHGIFQARILEWVAISFSIHTHTHTHTTLIDVYHPAWQLWNMDWVI